MEAKKSNPESISGFQRMIEISNSPQTLVSFTLLCVVTAISTTNPLLSIVMPFWVMVFSYLATKAIIVEFKKTISTYDDNASISARFISNAILDAAKQEREACRNECVDFSYHFDAGSPEREVLQQVAIRLDSHK